MIGAAELLGEFVHDVLDDFRRRQIVFVGSFAVLEIDIAVLRRALLMGMFGVHGPFPEGADVIPVHHSSKIVVIQDFDLGNLMRGAEAIEEVHKGNLGPVSYTHLHYISKNGYRKGKFLFFAGNFGKTAGGGLGEGRGKTSFCRLSPCDRRAKGL